MSNGDCIASWLGYEAFGKKLDEILIEIRNEISGRSQALQGERVSNGNNLNECSVGCRLAPVKLCM